MPPRAYAFCCLPPLAGALERSQPMNPSISDTGIRPTICCQPVFEPAPDKANAFSGDSAFSAK
ncbi:hypothetical protein [Nonomuraea recticatena]|uniref:hypothetical protein n=1 Tax=Nonomuraea recticatena TaxID=46178 RepID=UPI0036205145